MSVYDFTVKDNKGNDVSLSDYKGKVLLIVNTATKCGLTPQYKEGGSNSKKRELRLLQAASHWLNISCRDV